MQRSLASALLLFSGLILSPASHADGPATADAEPTPHVFELRTYHTHDGKLAELHTRFRDHTCALLEKHGAKLVGFWTPQDAKDGKGAKLVYLVQFPSRDAAKKTWKAFGEDPEWRKARDESQKNGPLVEKVESVFLDPDRLQRDEVSDSACAAAIDAGRARESAAVSGSSSPLGSSSAEGGTSLAGLAEKNPTGLSVNPM